MPEETTTAETTETKPDHVSEKLTAFEEQMRSLADQNARLAEHLTKLTTPKPAPVNTASWKERFYENEDQAVAEITQTATQTALHAMKQQMDAENRKNSDLAVLVADYPEITDPKSDLRRKAEAIYASLPEAEKASPSAYKIAIREAAADVGILPKSKRKDSMDDDESFTLTGNGGNATRAAERARKKGKKDVSDETMLFAELIGRPVDDEKYRERLKKAAERTSWGKFEKV